MTGELLWLSQRTRADIGYAVGLMTRLLHRRPKYACEVGMHILRYLNGTKEAAIGILPCEDG